MIGWSWVISERVCRISLKWPSVAIIDVASITVILLYVDMTHLFHALNSNFASNGLSLGLDRPQIRAYFLAWITRTLPTFVLLLVYVEHLLLLSAIDLIVTT